MTDLLNNMTVSGGFVHPLHNLHSEVRQRIAATNGATMTSVYSHRPKINFAACINHSSRLLKLRELERRDSPQPAQHKPVTTLGLPKMQKLERVRD
jgi:hypothetical protein